mmetsp:Transcript_14813/g.21184  ORF Transcript_14813/g.21184 Transcript_14813/m.21184 type:complete len:236 (-) Transcript_14813:106-813(-)|eukprot:CAMPEP_0184864864 /NCGR_PEP_ID=MMETSP0580-20130426/16149_1 /TAXON_ID=1118495 /ORGANISM="Dactyliosolen fragilissimus" /LENGTH=235 /DNA_ID=CAMNT_0027363789 /DNA_START=17 /DNA_END=724 /DNA_ORIENTATION=-
MGRYTTVQAYADNNPNMRAVSYDQTATKFQSNANVGESSSSDNNNKAKNPVAVNPEKVSNPYGSTAGAGSGEFHVYRHARAREMARLKALDDDEKRRIRDQAFESKVEKWNKEEDAKTEKRRKKRRREKEAKERKKNMKLGGVLLMDRNDVHTNKNFQSNDLKGDASKDEFEYTPIHVQPPSQKIGVQERKSEEDEYVDEKKLDSHIEPLPNKLPFANDGSFLEKMKKKNISSSK